MNETLYSWTFKFQKVVRQQNSGAVEDFILPYSAVYLWIQKWKNYWNRSTFAKVIAKIKVAPFLWPTVYIGQLAAVGHKYADDTYSHLIIRILFLKYLKFMKAVRWIFSPNSGNRKKSQKIVKRTSQ